MGFRPSRADPDFWLKPGIKEDGSKYWEMILCYVDDVLAINENPSTTLERIKGKFRLKNDKMDVPDNYLGADLSRLDNEDGDLCWGMSSDRYCQSLVTNIESVLAKKGLRLPSRCITPLKGGYKPELDSTCELKAD